jgi:hypothetical protein
MAGVADGPAPQGDLADLAAPPDLIANGITCGAMQCPVGERCCARTVGMTTTTMCASSCPDGGISAACDGPEDCTGNPCCAQIMANTTSGSSCTTMANACVPTYSIGTQSGQTRVCHVDGDCTSGGVTTNLNRCCTVTQNGVMAHICLNTVLAQFSGGTCP